MKTVLHLIDTSGPGGAEAVFLNLFEGFSRGEFRSVPLVTRGGWVEENLARWGVKSHVCRARGSFAGRYLLEIIRLIRSERIDLIQSHLLGASAYAAIAGTLTRIPTVSIFHGLVDMTEPNLRQWAKIEAIRIGSDRVVAVSKRLRDDLLARTSLKAAGSGSFDLFSLSSRRSETWLSFLWRRRF